MTLPDPTAHSPKSCSVSTTTGCVKGEPRRMSDSTDGGPQEIRQTIPDGLEVKANAYGNGVFATKFFTAGAVVYVGCQLVIPNEYAEFRLTIDNSTTTYLLNTDTHSVQFSEKQRWLYLFDSFMNHSCTPTTISRQTAEQHANNQYQTVALKDIYPGDEITCDYNLFEYDCEGKVIEQCLCGAKDCIGRIAGFKYLSISEQKKRIHLVDKEVLLEMSADSVNKFMYIPDLRCPTSNVIIAETTKVSGDADDSRFTYKLVASRSFNKGDVVFRNESLLFPSDFNLVIEVYGKRMWLNNLVHTVNKGNDLREFYYFDSFQNHSCDPNTEMKYITNTAYDLIALRDIAQFEELTSDYESFDAGFDGTSFKCQCGARTCKGVVNA